MDPPSDDPGPGQSENSSHQHGKKKKPDHHKGHGHSRPGSSRHGSSFLDRLHRRHDAKHHSEQAPLLADSEREETPEPEPQPQSQPHRGLSQEVFERVRSVNQMIPRPYPLFQALNRVGKSAGRGSKKMASWIGRHLKRHEKKYMGALIALLTASTIVFGVLFAQRASQGHKPTYCNTPSCVQAADTILKNMDPGVAEHVSAQNVFGVNSYPVDPCENFDQFVCGGFGQHHHFRSEQNEIYTGTLMGNEVDAILKHILEKPESNFSGADKKIFKLAKDDYKSCMDKETIQNLGIEPLRKVVEDTKANLPASKSLGPTRDYRLQLSTYAGDSRGDFLTDSMVDTILLGAPALLNFHVGPDGKAPDRQVIYASPVYAIGLPSRELYKDSDVVAEYGKACNESLSNFYKAPSNASTLWHGTSNSHASNTALSDKVVHFETKLAKIVPSLEKEQDFTRTYDKIALPEFNKMLPQMDMKVVFSGVARTTPAPKTMILSSPEYLQHLSSLLQETDKATLQAFFVWKVVQAWGDRIEDPGLSTLKDFDAKLKGTKTDQPEERWRQCVHDVNSDLGWITSRFYVNEHFTHSLKMTAAKIIHRIQAAYGKLLTESDWMSKEDCKVAAAKARSIQAKIGYPTATPNLRDASSVEDYYSFNDLGIAKDAYFDNGIGATKQHVRRQWTKVAGSPTDRNEWELYSTDVNAYYNPSLNEIFISAAILQPPVLYDPSLPSYVSYGSLGTIAGHEISHAFDPIGSRYDANGTYDDWWSDATAERFQDKAQCFIDQYSSYAVSGPKGDLNVDGNLTLAEAIADAGGAHAAFKAWKELDKKTKSKYLPGLKNFTKDQVFWLSYGNFWCSKITKERAMQIVRTDLHGPKSVRILGTVANSKGFREAWKCPSKEPTCGLW